MAAWLQALYFCPGYDSAAIYAEHHEANARHALPLSGSIRPHTNTPDAERRLRIGYVSAQFRDHCQMFFTTPLFVHHDRQHFEVFGYSHSPRSDQENLKM